MTSQVQLLSDVPLFKGLSDEDLEALSARLIRRRMQDRQTIISKGDTSSSMFVVLSGTVRIFLPPEKPGDSKIVLKDLEAGGFFGEMALLDKEPRTASVEAIGESVVGELTREDFVHQLQNSTQAVMAMLSEMSQRLRATTKLLSTPAARDVNREADEKLTWGERLADQVAHWNGSWMFILLLLALTSAWFEVNAIRATSFDPYPYAFYNLFLAILVALQGPLILMSQNRQAMKERLRSESDYQVNLRNELGIEQLQRELAQLRAELRNAGAAKPIPE
ncbi:MAG: DUF1003 domain-containing protein [Nevskia sp.]|nr:DUF1003 domain-containing protein [Nevskia sp.]